MVVMQRVYEFCTIEYIENVVQIFVVLKDRTIINLFDVKFKTANRHYVGNV